MYIEKTFDQLTEDERITYQLCYVERGKDTCEDGEITHYTYKLYFTKINLQYQWGDDWDDAPYDLNAEPPYDIHYWDDDVRKEHNIVIVTIKVKAEHYLELPGRIAYTSSYSVADINSRAAAWLYLPCNGKACNGASVLAGMSPQEVWWAIGHVIEEED